MDKHVHKNIGDQFRDEINSLSQQPREHVWEHIGQQLDKTDAENYKNKFTRLRKKTLLLLLLLAGIATFSLINFYTSKNKTTNTIALANVQQKEQNNITDAKKENIALANLHIKQSITAGNTFIPAVATEEKLNNAAKLILEKKGATNIKITKATAAEEAINITDTKSINEESNEDPDAAGIVTMSEKKIGTEKDISPIIFLKKDSNVITQTNEPLQKENKKRHSSNLKFTLTPFAGADYSAYRLVNDKANSYDNKTGIAKRERSDLSTSLGLLIGYRTGNTITIQSGIIYSSSNISINPTKIYAEKDNTGAVKFRYNTSSGYGYVLPSFSNSPAVGDSVFADGANHTLRYITMPVIVKFKLGHGKLTFDPGFGITLNFLTKATLTTDLVNQFSRETEVISKLEGIKKFSPGLLFTPELQYQLSKKFSISAMPYFKYSLGAINKGNVVKTYPYTVGLSAGFVYKF
jgi:hypothetical protein